MLNWGARRACKEDAIDPAAGIRLYKKTGDKVTAGEPIAALYTHRPEAVEAATAAYLAAVTVEDTPPPAQNLIFSVIK